MKKYTFEIFGRFTTISYGHIPYPIWRYIKTHCEESGSVYFDKINDEEVPEKYDISAEPGDPDACRGIDGIERNADKVLLIVDPEEVYISINENDKEILNEPLKAFASENDIEEEYTIIPQHKHFWCSEAGDKGVVCDGSIDSKVKFDRKKLKVFLRKFTNNRRVHESTGVTRIVYDGEELWNVDDGICGLFDGKYAILNVY